MSLDKRPHCMFVREDMSLSDTRSRNHYPPRKPCPRRTVCNQYTRPLRNSALTDRCLSGKGCHNHHWPRNSCPHMSGHTRIRHCCMFDLTDNYLFDTDYRSRHLDRNSFRHSRRLHMIRCCKIVRSDMNRQDMNHRTHRWPRTLFPHNWAYKYSSVPA